MTLRRFLTSLRWRPMLLTVGEVRAVRGRRVSSARTGVLDAELARLLREQGAAERRRSELLAEASELVRAAEAGH